MEPNELKHYGVKGMKWGVRRTQEQLDRAAGRKAEKQAKKAAAKEAKTPPRTAWNRYTKPINSEEYRSSGRQAVDSFQWGKKSAQRFADNLDKGQSLRKSKVKTSLRRTATLAAVVAGAEYASAAYQTGSLTLNYDKLIKSAMYAKSQNRGSDFAKAFSDRRGLPSANLIMASFDAASNTYRTN